MFQACLGFIFFGFNWFNSTIFCTCQFWLLVDVQLYKLPILFQVRWLIYFRVLPLWYRSVCNDKQHRSCTMLLYSLKQLMLSGTAVIKKLLYSFCFVIIIIIILFFNQNFEQQYWDVISTGNWSLVSLYQLKGTVPGPSPMSRLWTWCILSAMEELDPYCLVLIA